MIYKAASELDFDELFPRRLIASTENCMGDIKSRS